MIAELLSSALGLLLYLNTLGADFCYDDSRAIKTNQDLLPETPWNHIFFNDFWGTLLTHSGSHKSYRPLCTLSFRLNYLFGGLDPWNYHLVNVLLHSAVTGLFTNLCKALFGSGCWTLIAGLLFASHPIHTEAVSGIVGRADVGSGLFFLLSLLCYMKHCSTRGYSLSSWCWILCAGFWAACSMLWKEQGVTVLAVSAVYDVFVFHKLKMNQIISVVFKEKNVSFFFSVGLLFAWGVILLGARFYWMGNTPPSFSNSDNPAADCEVLLTRTLTFFYLPTKNLWLLFCPDTLSFDWSMDAVPLIKTITDWRNIHTVAFYILLILLAYSSLKGSAIKRDCNGKVFMNGKQNTNGHSCQSDLEHKNAEQNPVIASKLENGVKHHNSHEMQLPSTENIVVLALSLLIVPFVPASNLFFYVGFVIAERVLYIPSMGFCLLVTVGARALYIKAQKNILKNLLFYATAALIVFYGLKTVVRNGDWKNEEMLYRSGIKVNPAKAWGNLGNVLKSQSKIDEAENAYRNALYYRSNMADMLYNLGLLLQENSKFSEALHYYKLAIGSRPTLASGYLNTGIILMNQGRTEEARRTFLKCSEIPDENLKDPNAHKSSVTSCLYNLGKLYHEQGQYEDALIVYKEAIQKMPRQFSPQSLYNMMGEAYMRLNVVSEAEHWYTESLKSKPDHIPAHLTYGKLLTLTGRKNEAERYFLKAIQLDPNKGNCYMHYGQFLLEEGRILEAAEMAKKAAELDSSEFDVVFNAAHMLRQASLNEEAEKFYKLAAGLRQNYPAALMNLGAILHLNGKLEEAEYNYLRALQLKPDDAITQSNLRKLWNIMEKQGLKNSKT
ncbi:protein O-mannosyl-transferase TMTC2 precursor [Xenopus laevis]|uniref:Protein O-mannosyl-transferase tmtc2 n=1 Tax=Xenopus laevis TaxID=8355 RepID=TMTC2_XENLA|nr:protein O-mannosyl-transferase TMTC2 precursor [Xenopus laevis]Q6DCD5.1 RecName: Full=Protein O-mannosyl-transferase TMTC2; AltName: Full=Transmembrane and TPR repeat-containing protein 2 [Xenopus laevis]AAH78113.1 MGC83626 protein [Xenopus laevis]